MKEPQKIPLDPSTPKAKQVKQLPLRGLYPEAMHDDVYIRPDNDSVYIPVDILNKPVEQSFIENSINNLDKNEDSKNSD
jgi:hypothetical protein